MFCKTIVNESQEGTKGSTRNLFPHLDNNSAGTSDIRLSDVTVLEL